MSAPSPPPGLPAGRKLTLFLGMTAAGAIGLVALARAAIPAAPTEQQPALIAAFSVLYGMPPLLAALTVQGAIANEPVVAPLGFRLRPRPSWAIALVAPLVLGAGALGLALLEPGTSLVTNVAAYADRAAELQGHGGAATPALAREAQGLGAHPIWFTLAGALSIGGLLFQSAMLFPAELAFRGLFHHLLGGGVWRTGLVTGLVWGTWLALRDTVAPGWASAPGTTTVLRLAESVVLGLWLAHVRERTGSVLATTLFLAVLSRLAVAPQRLVAGASRVVVGSPGLALIAACGLGLVYLAWRDRRRRGGGSDPGTGTGTGAA